MKNHRTFLRIFFLLVTFGILGLMSVISNPVFANIRPVQLIHLLASGGCFGAAFMALGAHLHSRQSSAVKE